MKNAFFLAGCLLLCACGFSAASESSHRGVPSSASSRSLALYSPEQEEPEAVLTVEIASTPEARQRGMMGREDFGGSDGMLFVFEVPQILSFWMKNTIIPLDIVFFDAAGSVVSVATMIPCEGDPCPIYGSSEPALTALEVPSGFLEKYPVTPGWRMRLAE